MPGQHRLVLVNRNHRDRLARGLDIKDPSVRHAHPYLPTCICGWAGVARRRTFEAEEQYRQHVTQEWRLAGGGRRKRRHTRADDDDARREPTPIDQLPEELR